MSQQSQPENDNHLPNSPAETQVEEHLPVSAEQDQTISYKRSAEGLSIGGDSIADLIRKAKASRTAGGSGLKKVVEDTERGSSVAIGTPMDESLESALSCPICSDYLYRPVCILLLLVSCLRGLVEI